MQNLVRLIIGLPIAVVITMGLFLIMRFLVEPEQFQLPEESEDIVIDLTRQTQDEEAQEKQRDITRPERQDPPPPPPPANPNPSNQPNLSGVPIGATGGFDGNFDLNIDAPTDRDVQPIVYVPPQYPQRAAERGIEGWVRVRFDVNEEGGVENPEVIAYEPSTIFNRAALRTVVKFRYKPKVVDGEPVRQEGVEFEFEFELADDGRRR